MQQNRSRTVQLALIVAGLIGLAMLLDKILQTTGKLAQETVASTAETMRSAVEGAFQAVVPTEMVPQHKTIEEQLAEAMEWAERDELAEDGPDWTDDGPAGVLTFNDAGLGGGGGAMLPPPSLIGEDM